MAIIENCTRTKHWRGCGEKGIFLHCWWLVHSCCSHYEEYDGKLKIELLHDPASPVLGIYPNKILIQRDNMHSSMFTAALFTGAKA